MYYYIANQSIIHSVCCLWSVSLCFKHSTASLHYLTLLPLPVLNVSKIILNVSTGFNLILNLQTVLRKQIQVYENRFPINKMSCSLQTLMYTLLAYYLLLHNGEWLQQLQLSHLCRSFMWPLWFSMYFSGLCVATGWDYISFFSKTGKATLVDNACIA